MLRRLQTAEGRVKAPTQHDLDTIAALVYLGYVELPHMGGQNPMPMDDGRGWISVYAPLTDRGEQMLRTAG